jgi:DNA helicase-2/ATP-dependent DNA helicase PcrA
LSTAPPELGRGVIVAEGAVAPDAWKDAPRVRIGPDDVASEGAAADVVAALRTHWLARDPVVIELATDPAGFRDPTEITAAPYSLDAGLDLPLDRLHHLVWANNYDARSDGSPIWWWTAKAERLGASAGPDGGPDVVLADGSAAWIDGGPRHSAPAGRLAEAVVHSSTVDSGRLTAVVLGEGGEDAESRISLAPDQLAAVTHHGGPVRVIAPAGSGKTRVLTERIRLLLGERGYDREALLAVAYNKEAQRELEARLFRLQPRTRTLNSLGYRIVAEHRGGRPPLLEEREVRNMIGDLFPIPRQRRANTDPVGPYLDALTLTRLGLRDPAEVEASRDDVDGFADGFDAYRRALAGRGAVDFDEQIYGSLEALLADGPFRRRMQAEHRHMLVDEFQDLTPAHVLLIRLLAMPALDVFGVGDDDQTIYDHAGADPAFLVRYTDYFPGADATALEVNYRSAEPIVVAARTLLSYNRNRVEKEIRAAEGADTSPEALDVQLHAPAAAAEAVVGIVSRWRRDEDVDADRIAILARVNSLLMAPQIALWSAGVPLRSSVSPDVLERTGVAAALAWIRVAVDPSNLIGSDLDLIRRRPSRGFPMWISKWFANCRSLEDVRRVGAKIDDARVSGRVGEMADDIALLAGRAEAGDDARALLEFIRDRIGLGSAMEMLDGSKGTQATASHLDDLEALIQVSDLHTDPHTFEPWLRASLTESAGSEGVTLSTVHRVKGREWDRVIVFGVTDGLLPHRLSEDWESERRVMHVAITRAIDRCVVLGDEARRSAFLDELTGKAEQAAKAPESVILPPGVGGAGPRKRGGAPARPAPDLGEHALAPAASEALRTWRTERSDADRVPPYVVLSNRHIDAIAVAMPANARELLACEGIGPTKLERYGDEILAVLDHVRS